MAKGVLFDMDGVLVATEELKAIAHSETVTRFGGNFAPDFYSEVMGRSHYDAAAAFARAAGIPFDYDAYMKTFGSIYAGLIESRLELALGARELVVAVNDSGYRLAVVSSSLRWMMDEVLARSGLGPLFPVAVSGDDVEEEKPSPEPYLRALRETQLRPDQAVVIEDTESGVTSALNAGVAVIAVRHRYNGTHDFSGAAEIEGLENTSSLLGLIESVLDAG